MAALRAAKLSLVISWCLAVNVYEWRGQFRIEQRLEGCSHSTLLRVTTSLPDSTRVDFGVVSLGLVYPTLCVLVSMTVLYRARRASSRKHAGVLTTNMGRPPITDIQRCARKGYSDVRKVEDAHVVTLIR